MEGEEAGACQGEAADVGVECGEGRGGSDLAGSKGAASVPETQHTSMDSVLEQQHVGVD